MRNVYGEACISKQIFTNRLNIGLPLRTCVEKIIPLSGNILTLVKKKIPDAMVSKEGHADSILWPKREGSVLMV